MNERIQAILLAGGLGTRLYPITETVPKALVPVAGRPMIYFVLDQLKKHRITNVALAISYLGELLQEELGDGSSLGMRISYLIEPEPMGTGGWSQIVNWDDLDDHFLLLNADNLFWIDIDAFLARHREVGALATIAAIPAPMENLGSCELAVPDAYERTLESYLDRSTPEEEIRKLRGFFGSSGWYVMTPGVQEIIPKQNPISNETDIWPRLAAEKCTLGFYHAKEPWFDSGTPERIKRIETFLNEHPDL